MSALRKTNLWGFDLIDKTGVSTLLRTISQTISHHNESASYDSAAYDSPTDTLLLAVALPQSISPALEVDDAEWEDLCREAGGWEYMDSEANKGGKNEFGG